MKGFDEFLMHFVPYDKEGFEAFKGAFEPTSHKLAKKELLFEDGDTINKLYFFEEGHLRGFYKTASGDEITSNLLSSPLLFTDNYASTHKIPTRLNLQALTPVSYYSLSLQKSEELANMPLTVTNFFRVYFSHIFNLYYGAKLSLIYETIEERYLRVVREYPELMKIIPQHYLASYLGIRPETLSRIRKKIMKNSL